MQAAETTIDTSDAPSVPHAIVRAKERYGIELKLGDLRDLAERCEKGEGRTGGKCDGTQFHTLILRDRVLWLVYRPAVPPHKWGNVVTIMPPRVGSAMVRAHDQQKFRRLNGYAKKRRR